MNMTNSVSTAESGTLRCRLIPALDLLDGRAVRLLRGDFSRVTDYGDPAHWVARWWDAGARELHVVDLAGARDGQCSILPLLSQWASRGWVLQLGGGLRSREAVSDALDAGVSRAVLGTAAVREPDFLADCLVQFGASSIVGGLDLREGKPQVAGWSGDALLDTVDLLELWRNAGLQWVLSTAISRDGTLEGPDLEQYRRLRLALPGVSLIASGGVRHQADLDVLGAIGVNAAVAGRALLDGLFNLDQLWR